MSGSGPRGYRLPRGRHGLSAAEVEANQRLRLMAAGAALAAEQGVGRVTARAIAGEAGVSSSTLHRLFSGAEEVLASAAELAAASLCRAVEEACEGAVEEQARLGASLVAACEWAAGDPASATLIGPAAMIVVPEIASTRERLVGRFSGRLGALSRGLGATRDPETRALAVSAVLTMLSERAAALPREEAHGLGLELAELLG